MAVFKTSLMGFFFLTQVLFAGAVFAETEQVYRSQGNQTQLLELYTSQGCSSCPPADQWLSRWKQHPGLWTDVVPVAFHVDYWDWIGWQDPFASAEHGRRQQRYKKLGAVKSVYTPGFVIDGNEWRGWFERKDLPVANTKQGVLIATFSNNRLAIEYRNDSLPETSVGLIVHVTLLGFDLKTQVQRGENTNRTLHEDFVVLWHRSSQSGSPWSFPLPDSDTLPTDQIGFAIWVNARDSAHPLQVLGGRL